MKINQLAGLLCISVAIILNSCVSNKKLTYLQYSTRSADQETSRTDQRESITPSEYKVMPYDNLYIRVITPDPEWSALFNMMPVGTGGAVTEESLALFGYPVDLDGNIEIPFVGKVKAEGRTLQEIKIDLDSIFKNYVSDAAITVRLVNNYVSVIGEVARPGRYLLTKDRVNILEVISMAGDLREFSNRQKLQLIRPSRYGPVIKVFTLNDRSILSSELYHVMPNDIIYAPPLKAKAFDINASVWTLFMSTITSALGVIAFFRTL